MVLAKQYETVGTINNGLNVIITLRKGTDRAVRGDKA